MMRRFGANTDKRRLAVTLGLLLLAAVLLFAAEAVLDNLHGRPSGEPERITADALILSGAKAEGDGFSLSGAGSAGVRRHAGGRRQRYVFNLGDGGPHLPRARFAENRRASGGIRPVQSLRVFLAGRDRHRAARRHRRAQRPPDV